jgi:hypothetical protein
MSSNNEEVLKLMQAYRVLPLASIPGLKNALNARGKASPEAEQLITQAGYVWNPKKGIYSSERNYQFIAALPQDVFVWAFNQIGKVLKNTIKLEVWVNQKSEAFITSFSSVSGIADPIQTGPEGTRPVEPAPASQPSEIEKILQTVKSGSRLPADKIIDIYKLAKDTGNEELMNLVKTLQIQEGVKKSELKNILREIVKGIFKEMTTTGAVSPISTPMAFSKKGANPKTEEEQIEEMTTTSAVSGYNVPSAFARKGGSHAGVEGSRKLGYELTGIGKKEMNRRGDNL